MSDALARTLLVLVVVVAIAATLWAMRHGWRNRAGRQQDVAEPPAVPARLGRVIYGPVSGRYLGSVNAGDWLDRIVVHGLGVRSGAEAECAEDGLLLRRQGARDLFIPRGDIRAVRADRGIAGRVHERGGVLVVTWDLGGRLVDSGFRADVGDEQVALRGAIDSVLAEERMS